MAFSFKLYKQLLLQKDHSILFKSNSSFTTVWFPFPIDLYFV